ncbi:primosomal replication protein N [Agarivorans sp. MS3-6]|uniref:primosomal replication protein N n=1 Tax=Agarivorans sp. TSD2052 TaxID=2937286 RepID=UPI00200BDD73|nr:primosomal replication protein N [Agarivorans sp. TSD2052]UPW17905.1 primosomal replication protein N [Agarivorans sp. TSD2052]
MSENRLVLQGRVLRAPKRSTSPAGVAHCQFWLEHRSQQQEAGFSRQAYCQMAVVASGDILKQDSSHISMGCEVKVSGFLSSHKAANGTYRLVLHASEIDLLSRG